MDIRPKQQIEKKENDSDPVAEEIGQMEMADTLWFHSFHGYRQHFFTFDFFCTIQ